MTSQQKVLYTLHQSLGDFLKVAQKRNHITRPHQPFLYCGN